MTYYQLVSWVIKAQEQYPEYQNDLINIIAASFVHHDLNAKLLDIRANIEALINKADQEVSADLTQLLQQIDSNPQALLDGLRLVFSSSHTLDLADALQTDKLRKTTNIGLAPYAKRDLRIHGTGEGGNEQFRADYSQRVFGLNGQYNLGCETKADKVNAMSPIFADKVTAAVAKVLNIDPAEHSVLLQAFFKAYTQDLFGSLFGIYSGAIVESDGTRSDEVLTQVSRIPMSHFVYLHDNQLYFRGVTAYGFDVTEMKDVGDVSAEKFIPGVTHYTYKLVGVGTDNPEFQLVKVESDHPLVTGIYAGNVVTKEVLFNQLAMPKISYKDQGFNLVECYNGLANVMTPEHMRFADVKATLKSPIVYLSQLSNHAFKLETNNLIAKPDEILKLIADLPPFSYLDIQQINLSESEITKQDLLTPLYQQNKWLSVALRKEIQKAPVTHQFYMLSAFLALSQLDPSPSMQQYLANLSLKDYPYLYATMSNGMVEQYYDDNLLNYNDSNSTADEASQDGVIDQTYNLIQQMQQAQASKPIPEKIAFGTSDDENSSDSDSQIIIREKPASRVLPQPPVGRSMPSWLPRALFVGAIVLGVALLVGASVATSGLILLPLAVVITGLVLGGLVTAGGVMGLVQHEVRQNNKRKAEIVIDPTYTRSVVPESKRQRSGEPALVSRHSFLASDHSSLPKAGVAPIKRLR